MRQTKPAFVRVGPVNVAVAPGNGILNTDGDLWQIQRKVGLRSLSNARLKHIISKVFPPYMTEFHRRLHVAYADDKIIDLQTELVNLTTGLFGKIVYGVSVAS